MTHGGEMIKKKLSPFGYRDNRDAIWFYVRQFRVFTLDQLEDCTRINRDTIKSYLQGLQKAGYVKHLGKPDPKNGTGNRHVSGQYQLISDCGVEAPKINRQGRLVNTGDKREQMWRTMKILNEFTYRDLAINASIEDSAISNDDAKSYCNKLAKAGYLAVVKKGTRTSLTRYRFLNSKNTGPKPPRVKKVTQVFDPNTNKVMWTSGGDS